MEPIAERRFMLANGMAIHLIERRGWTTFAVTLDLGIGWGDDDAAAPGLAMLLPRLYAEPELAPSSAPGLGWRWWCAIADTFVSVAGHPSHLGETLASLARIMDPRPLTRQAFEEGLRALKREGQAERAAPRTRVLEAARARMVGDEVLARDSLADLRPLGRLTFDEIASRHARGWSSRNARLTLASPTPIDELAARVEQTLGRVVSRAEPLAERPRREPAARSELVVRFVADAQPPWVIVAQPLASAEPTAQVMLLRQLALRAISEGLEAVPAHETWSAGAPQCATHHFGPRGIFELSVTLPPRRVIAGLELVLARIEQAQRSPPEQADVMAARREVTEYLEMVEGDPSEVCRLLAGQGMRQASPWRGSLAELREAVARVEPAELGALARRVFAPTSRSVLVVGPLPLLTSWRARRLVRRFDRDPEHPRGAGHHA